MNVSYIISGLWLKQGKVPLHIVICFTIVLFTTIGLAIVSEMYLIVAPILMAIPVLFLLIHFPRWWIYTGACLLYIWFRSSDADISAIELLLIVFYWGGFGLWCLQMLVRRNAIIKNNADKLLILTFILAFVFNSTVAWLNGSSLLLWLREFLLLTFILFYFPIRECFTEKKHIITLLLILMSVVFALGITNIQLYIGATQNALQASDLVNSRVSLNETIFVDAALFSIVFFLYSKRWYYKLPLLFFSIYCVGVLLASLSRGPWLSFIIGLFWVFFFVEKKKKVEIAMLAVTGSCAILVAISLFFGHIGELIINGIEMRFLSSTKGSADISVKSRLVESEAAIEVFLTHPLSGIGMGSSFAFFEPIGQYTSHKTFTHNGYLFIALKWGGPLALLLFFTLFLYLRQGQKIIRVHSRNSFYKGLAIASTSTLLASLILNVPANQFIMRDSLFLMAFSIACISIAEGELKRNNIDVMRLN